MAFDLVAVLRLNDQFTSPMRRVVKQTEQLRNTTKLLTSDTGRFIDANGRLMDAQGRFTKSTVAASGGLVGFNSKLGAVTATIGGLVTGLAAAAAAQKTFNATIGEAAKFEQSQVLIEAMFDDKKASDDYTKMLQRFAENSPVLNSQDMFSNSKSLISLSKDAKVLEKAWKNVEKLTVMDPKQGVEGAVFALRELAGGDTVSLASRFEIPRKALNEIKNLSFKEQVEALDKLMAKMNITDKVVEKMGNTTLAKWNQFKEKLSAGLRDMGMDALEHAKPAIENMTKLLDSKQFAQFQADASKALASAFKGVSDFVTYLVNNRQAIADFASGAIQVLTDVGTAIKNVALFVVNNWSVIKPIIVGVATSFLAFKTVTTAVTLVRGAITAFNSLKNVFGYVKKAFTLLRLSMLTFPGGWLIVAIGAVVAAGVRLYKNWDKVKAKAGQLWTWIKGKWQSIKDWTAKTWDSVKTKIGSAMDSARKKVSNFFSPLMNFISNAREKWNGFINAIKSFRMPKFKMPSFGGGGGARGKGNFHGLPTVPYNGYTTALHKGEMVLPRKEADAYRRGTTGGNVTNLTVHYHGGQKLDEQEMARFSDWLLRKIEQAEAGGA